MVIVLMGVTGAGKTTVGRLLAAELGWAFLDADDLHPAANVAKMARGEALTDRDRAPWLGAVRAAIADHRARGASVVVACSALRAAYRRYLVCGNPGLRFVYLRGEHALIARRLADRRGHFMPPALLDSQFATLEEPRDALVVEVTAAPDVLARAIAAAVAPSDWQRRNMVQ